jgi:all-trans-retinol 13,14-reductase
MRSRNFAVAVAMRLCVRASMHLQGFQFMNYDVIVIGSGISGLTSALLFAKKGKKVAVFEQAPLIAPLFSGFTRNGVHFDTGFHYSGVLGPDEVGGHMFKQLGCDVEVEQCDPDGYDLAYFEKSKRIFKIPSGYERLEQRLTQYFPKEKDGIKRYMSLVRKEMEGVPFLNLHKRKYAPEELYSFISSNKTLREVLDECFENEELKSFLSFGSVLYGVEPSSASFMLHCCCNGIMYESVWKFKNGSESLVKAYVKALKENNVDVFTNKKAVKIECAGARKTIVFEDGSNASCDICVASVHPKEFVKIAPEGTYRKKTVERINAFEETRSFFMLFAKAKQSLFDKPLSNAGVLREDGLKTDFKDFMYINMSGKEHNALSVVLSVDSDEKLWNLPQDGYARIKNEYTKKLKDWLNKYYPGLIDKMEFLDAATPRTFNRWLNYYGAYGIKRKVNSVSVIPITKIAGLFLTGQATVAPGLIGAMISAFLLDKMIERQS